jgi:hypothetical protein
MDQSRLFPKITSTLFRPLHTILQQCCVQCITRRILRPHTDTTTCASQCLKNLVRCMSTPRKQVLQTCLPLCKRKFRRSITEINCVVVPPALCQVSHAILSFTLTSDSVDSILALDLLYAFVRSYILINGYDVQLPYISSSAKHGHMKFSLLSCALYPWRYE